MSRVDEFSRVSLITRIEWIDRKGATWGDDFVPDPGDPNKQLSEVTGTANESALAEVVHRDGTTRVYTVRVGQKVIWNSSRRTYTFPR